MEYKVINNQVFYWNGIKWLVKETCKDNKEAKKLVDELRERESVGKVNGI